MILADFRSLYPEFAAETDQRVQSMLDEAVLFLDQCRWGCWYEKGLGLYAAHQLALSNALSGTTGGAAGSTSVAMASPVTSKRVGDVQVNMDSTNAEKQSENPFARTVYGQQYLYYQKLAGTGVVAV